MTMTYLPAVAALVGGLTLAVAAQAEMRVIKPVKNITVIKLPSQAVSVLDIIVDTNNAHPVELMGFFVPTARGAAEQLAFEMGDEYEPFLRLKRGADCAISGVRILRDEEKLRVIYATRKGGWAEKKPVNFAVFDLAKNEDGMPSTPNLYFKEVKKVSTSTSYCDVNSALDKESRLYQD